MHRGEIANLIGPRPSHELVRESGCPPFVPQTNLQAGKRRPALVVANLKGDDLILCQITSQARSDGYSVALTSSDFERGRLAVDSFVRPNRLSRSNNRWSSTLRAR